jgi:SAM-dependent methyltransferase
MKTATPQPIEEPLSADFVALLKCPECGAQLRMDGATAVTCSSRHSFPVVRNIPRLVPEDLNALQEQTAAAFGWQWQHFDEMHDEFEQQFLGWVKPLDPAFFEGKVVLDAGCGMGRHMYFVSRYRAEMIVGLDLSRAVDAASALLADQPHTFLVQGDLTRPPLDPDGKGSFDRVYSIGVLHHLPEPEAGFRALLRLVRPGGAIFIWVYGYEGNGFVRRVVEPLRKFSTRIPPPLLRGLALPLAVAFHALALSVYRPARLKRLSRRLPLAAYMESVSKFTFRQNYGIVFDQLVAPKSHYISRGELERWAAATGLEDIAITSRNDNSWRLFGRRPHDERRVTSTK